MFLRSPRGQIILLALVFFAILLTMATALISYSIVYAKNERVVVTNQQALNLAEAGVDEAASELNQNASYTGETGTSAGSGQFTVTVTTVNSNTKLITATGYIPNSTNPTSTKTVKAELSINSNVVSFRYGVQVGAGGFVMNGGAQLNGSIYSNGSIVATNGVKITGSAIAADPASLSGDQLNNSPTPIASCTGSTCITFANASASQDFAQSFSISTSSPINSIGFYIKKVGSPSDETVDIVPDSSGSPGSTVLLTGTLSASSITTTFGWATTTMSTQTPVLDPSQTYWIVIHGSSNASKYYIIGSNSSYGGGVAKLGKLGGSWTNTSPSGLDGYFQIFLGGGTSTIGGDTYATGVTIGQTGSDEAWAHTIQGATVSGPMYCQSSSHTSPASCNTSQSDPTPQGMPISDGNIQDWENEGASGTVLNGNQTYGSSGGALGPAKINGNLTVNGGGTLTMTGTLWVTGSLTLTGGGNIQLDSSYGANEGVILLNGPADIEGGSHFYGSGGGGYPFIITTSDCPVSSSCGAADAIYFSGGAASVGLVAQNGTVDLEGGTNLKTVTANQILMKGGSTLTYDSGLANANFTDGPGGSWAFVKGTYSIAQ